MKGEINILCNHTVSAQWITPFTTYTCTYNSAITEMQLPLYNILVQSIRPYYVHEKL